MRKREKKYDDYEPESELEKRIISAFRQDN